MLCVLIKSASTRQSNENTQYTIFNIKITSSEIILNLQLWDCSKGLKNEFETAVVNVPSVFKPLKDYRIAFLFPFVFQKISKIKIILQDRFKSLRLFLRDFLFQKGKTCLITESICYYELMKTSLTFYAPVFFLNQFSSFLFLQV